MKTDNKRGALPLIVRIACIFIALALISATGIALYRVQIMKTSSADYIDKLEILKSIQTEKKAVFIGGSSTGKGISCELFEQKTGIRAVNVSASAGCSFKLLFESVAPYLKAGDCLFIAPEYGYYSSDWNSISSEESINFLLYINPEARKCVQTPEYIKALPDLFTIGLADIGYTVQELIKSAMFGGFGIYNRGSINANGDTVAHKDKKGGGVGNIAVLGYRERGFLKSLSARAAQLEATGVSVILLYPPFEEKSYDANEKVIAKISQSVSRSGMNVLYAPAESRYGNACFYDTCYHLTYDMAQVHTRMIIDKYLNNSEVQV